MRCWGRGTPRGRMVERPVVEVEAELLEPEVEEREAEAEVEAPVSVTASMAWLRMVSACCCSHRRVLSPSSPRNLTTSTSPRPGSYAASTAAITIEPSTRGEIAWSGEEFVTFHKRYFTYLEIFIH